MNTVNSTTSLQPAWVTFWNLSD